MSLTMYSSPMEPEPQIVISVHPRHAENILTGTKTVEFRRRFPVGSHLEGAILWIYSTSPIKAVTGWAEVKDIINMPVESLWTSFHSDGGVKRGDFDLYFDGARDGYAIVLSSITRLSEEIHAERFSNNGFSIPQSYRYVNKKISPLLKKVLLENPSRYERRHQTGRSQAG